MALDAQCQDLDCQEKKLNVCDGKKSIHVFGIKRIKYMNKSFFPDENISFLFRFVQDSRSGATTAGRGQSHAARRKGLKETIMAPSTGGAFSIGQGALAGASVVGLGALAFYGLGLSNEVGAVDRAVFWSQDVKNRIR